MAIRRLQFLRFKPRLPASSALILCYDDRRLQFFRFNPCFPATSSLMLCCSADDELRWGNERHRKVLSLSNLCVLCVLCVEVFDLQSGFSRDRHSWQRLPPQATSRIQALQPRLSVFGRSRPSYPHHAEACFFPPMVHFNDGTAFDERRCTSQSHSALAHVLRVGHLFELVS